MLHCNWTCTLYTGWCRIGGELDYYLTLLDGAVIRGTTHCCDGSKRNVDVLCFENSIYWVASQRWCGWVFASVRAKSSTWPSFCRTTTRRRRTQRQTASEYGCTEGRGALTGDGYEVYVDDIWQWFVQCPIVRSIFSSPMNPFCRWFFPRDDRIVEMPSGPLQSVYLVIECVRILREYINLKIHLIKISLNARSLELYYVLSYLFDIFMQQFIVGGYPGP